jgi:type I restriction enzyme S subunit
MKDSGVEWIGEIPSHWYWKRMCYMFKPISMKNTSGEMNLSVYRDYGVIPTNSRDDNHNVISEDTSNYKMVNVGDFVMNKMKCWMGSLGLSDYRGIVSPSYTVMKPLTQNNRKYLHYLLRSQVYIPQYRKLSYGVRIGQWDMRFEDFRELPCLIPPLTEQQQIVEYLDEQTQLIDNTMSIEEKRIELLKEYRQSLISEVVTGKRKVV